MKNIVVTGASRGIGFELVKILAGQGHNILALSRNDRPIQSLKLDNVHAFPFDLSRDKSLDQMVDYVNHQWKQVDILINNAGKLVNKPFLETTKEDFEAVYNVNVYGVAEVTKRLMPKMVKGSHVVTISSMGGIQGSMKFAGLSAYSSSKGAVITLMELLAEEFKEEGIAFNTLAIGAVQTEMLEEAFPGYQAPLQPAEMANYVADFAVSGNKFYNGKTLQVSSSTP